jgi:hypothetical protein
VSTKNLRDWLEIVGLFSVVASLIFVGLQMKQTQEIALASQYQSRADVQMELLLTNMETGYSRLSMSNESPSYVYDNPDVTDLNYLYNLVRHAWYSFDNNHYQYESGLLPAEHWAGQVRSIQEMHSECSVRFIWAVYVRPFARQSFVDFVDSLEDRCSPEDAAPMWSRPERPEATD